MRVSRGREEKRWDILSTVRTGFYKRLLTVRSTAWFTTVGKAWLCCALDRHDVRFRCCSNCRRRGVLRIHARTKSMGVEYISFPGYFLPSNWYKHIERRWISQNCVELGYTWHLAVRICWLRRGPREWDDETPTSAHFFLFLQFPSFPCSPFSC